MKYRILTPWPPGDATVHFLWNGPEVNATTSHWRLATIGSGNAEIQIDYFLMGAWDPLAMILMGPWALGIGPIIDVFIHFEF